MICTEQRVKWISFDIKLSTYKIYENTTHIHDIKVDKVKGKIAKRKEIVVFSVVFIIPLPPPIHSLYSNLNDIYKIFNML